MKLLIEYYKPKVFSRETEYLTCINANLNNDVIDEIYVFISDNSVLDMINDKLKVIKLNDRPTYDYLFKFCNDRFNKDELCIIANTDIIFDETLNIPLNHNMNNIFLALTRWDLIKTNQDGEFDIKFFDVNMSQDAWIFKIPINIHDADFLMGKPGCDNKIAYLAYKDGYKVLNPSKSIIIKHLHISGHRTYTVLDTVPMPYLFLHPNDDINKDTICRLIE